MQSSTNSNVYYRNSTMLAKSLEQQNIPFEQITYANKQHDLDVRPHLYLTTDKFPSDCFNLKHTH